MKIDLNLNLTFTLTGQVRLEGPQTQNVHRPITLAGADDLFFLLYPPPHLSHGNVLGKVNENNSRFSVSLTYGCKLPPVCVCNIWDRCFISAARQLLTT